MFQYNRMRSSYNKKCLKLRKKGWEEKCDKKNCYTKKFTDFMTKLIRQQVNITELVPRFLIFIPTVVGSNSTVANKNSIMKRFLGIVIVIALAVITSSAINCNNDKCRESGKQHTMCRYTSSKPAAACGRVISVGFTNDEKKQIVDAHNKRRSFVAQGSEKRGKPGPQPPASNMQTMSWDNEIAEIAQRWANQCNFGHDSCRHVDRYHVGQNAAMTMTTGTVATTPSEIVDIWYNEVKDMDRNQVSRLTNINNVGHYTQLVWAKSNRVGCGKIVHQANQWKKYYVICNYGPAGNYINEPIYQIRK